MNNRLKKTVLIVCGTLCVGLATLGLFLPVMPTTPLLLLAAACYARSSDRFYHWLLNNRWFGVYIRNYREGRGISLTHKIMAISLMWLTIVYAAWLDATPWLVKIMLLGIAVAVTVHLVKTKTYYPRKQHPGAELVAEGDEAPGS